MILNWWILISKVEWEIFRLKRNNDHSERYRSKKSILFKYDKIG